MFRFQMTSTWGFCIHIVVLLILNIIEIQCNVNDFKPHKSQANVGFSGNMQNDYSFQVSLQLRGSHVCSGALITMRHVLTAAHCVYEVKPSGYNDLLDPLQLEVVAGTWDKLNCNPRGQSRLAMEIIAHEGYSPDRESMDHDIAIVKVLEDFYVSAQVIPIALHEGNATGGEICHSSGWGVTHSHGLVSRYLSNVLLPLWTYKRCQIRYGSGLTDNMVCAGSGHKKGVCQGESGAPLICEGELVGVMSWGFGCISTTFPTIFTNLTQYAEWIEDNAFSSTNNLQYHMSISYLLVSYVLYYLYVSK
ncbi:anionic trypsin-2-like [Arctopsyche grandis]|uniref:anionic trypsin-2-like n=1 Tax=Arctopsyche grandis TaxID=121162 RepID=UPI00406D6604